MQRVIAVLLFFLTCLAHAKNTLDWARELAPAEKAMAGGRTTEAYGRYLKLAVRNPLAQLMVGRFHQNGWGREKDLVVACSWFEKAAHQHIPVAEHLWGDCLAQGIGRAVDVPVALIWYEQAASHGHLISACTAADRYIKGEGVQQDVVKGLALCNQVAQANSSPAMLQMGRYYQDGRYVPQDLAVARQWYRRAAEQGAAEAQYRLGVMLAQGEGGEPDLNSALYLLESAAGTGYAPAYLPTAILYANAPVQKDTGALAPEHLAKIYLWASAAHARGTPKERVEAEKIEAQVLSIMPATWRPDLDRQVAAHLTMYSK